MLYAVRFNPAKMSRTQDDNYRQRGIHPGEHLLDKKLKIAAYKKLLGRAQKQMSPFQKSISRVLHQQQIEALSEFTAKTVGNCWGILGAGIFASAGSLLYALAAAYYSISYNSTFILIFLIFGYLSGVTMKLLSKTTRY